MNLLILLLFLSQKAINFLKEEIEIKIQDSILEVKGVYYFKNEANWGVLTILEYPFPVDKNHYYPLFIDVKNITFKKRKNSIFFPLNFKPFEIKKVDVIYKQKLKNKKARYILLTTKMWGKPLKEAHFKIEVPLSFKNLKISYKPQKIEIIGNKKILYINKKNFIPEKDILIEWE